MIQITELDIDQIEELMQVRFDNERRTVIKSMDRCDILACPGSGKTTTLVAKVGILGHRVPINTGICILSHTNVAGNVIYKRLSGRGRILTEYPNFLGTIQSFVNRFLAIPALIDFYGVRPWIVDDEAYRKIIELQSQYLPKKIRHVLELDPNKKGDLGRLRYSFSDLGVVWLAQSGEKPYLKDKSKPTYQALERLKSKITHQGCIAFYDAYALANAYIRKYPQICSVISQRFRYIFVDEAQDTTQYQWKVLQQVFRDSLIIQCFGDKNQAIYNDVGADDEQIWIDGFASKHITTSHRLSPSIATLCENTAVTKQSIIGNKNRPDSKHTIFLFDDPKLVLPAYAQLILDQGLKQAETPHKLVGLRKKHEKELSLIAYFEGFSKSGRNLEDQDGLRAYFTLARKEAKNGNVAAAQKWLQLGITKLAQLQGLRNDNRTYTSNSLLEAWQRKDPDALHLFHLDLFNWINAFVTDSVIPNQEVRETLKQWIGKMIQDEWIWTPDAAAFLMDNSPPHHESLKSDKNIYRTDDLEIHIDTIHGVKGETHCATLLVETFSNTYHLKKILPYLKGNRPQNIKTNYLRTAYVAMSRPTHLLCLAMRKTDVSEGDRKALEERGWNFSFV